MGINAPCEVVKVVHDDGNEEVQHDESAEEDEGDKVDVGAVGPAGLFRIQQSSRSVVSFISSFVTWPARVRVKSVLGLFIIWTFS